MSLLLKNELLFSQRLDLIQCVRLHIYCITDQLTCCLGDAAQSELIYRIEAKNRMCEYLYLYITAIAVSAGNVFTL